MSDMDQNCATMPDMSGHPLENALAEQIRLRMMREKVTQTALGRRILPDVNRPEATIGNYLGGRKSLLTGVLLKILEDLGAESIEVKWKDKTD